MQVNTHFQGSFLGITAEKILITFNRTMLTTNLLFNDSLSYNCPACLPVCANSYRLE